MLIRQKRLPKSQINHEQNMDNSAEGKKRFADAEELQANLQGSLSDVVREYDDRPEELDQAVMDWHKNLDSSEFTGDTPRSRRGSDIKRVGRIVGGKYVSGGTYKSKLNLKK